MEKAASQSRQSADILREASKTDAISNIPYSNAAQQGGANAATVAEMAGGATALAKGAFVGGKWVLKNAPELLAKRGDDVAKVAGKQVDEVGGAPKGTPAAFAPDILQQSRLTQLPPAKIKEILDTPKGSRPDPSDYMSNAAIQKHLKPFDAGAVRIQPSVQTGTIGRSETWVFPKTLVDDAVKQSKGDPRKLESLLGLDPGYLGKSPVRVDIPSPVNARIPTGNEFGANNFWRPGGFTHPGGIKEAIIDPVPVGSYTTSKVF